MSRRTRKTVSEDDTHNEEYCGCVILIIPLTLSQSLMLFDSSQQPCEKYVLVRACASECICMQEFAILDSVCHIWLSQNVNMLSVTFSEGNFFTCRV